MTPIPHHCSRRSGAGSSKCQNGWALGLGTWLRPFCDVTPAAVWPSKTFCLTRGSPARPATTLPEIPLTTPSPPCLCSHQTTSHSRRRPQLQPPRTRPAYSACRVPKAMAGHCSDWYVQLDASLTSDRTYEIPVDSVAIKFMKMVYPHQKSCISSGFQLYQWMRLYTIYLSGSKIYILAY